MDGQGKSLLSCASLQAPVAQRIRVLASEAKGRGFESRRARQSRINSFLHEMRPHEHFKRAPAITFCRPCISQAHLHRSVALGRKWNLRASEVFTRKDREGTPTCLKECAFCKFCTLVFGKKCDMFAAHCVTPQKTALQQTESNGSDRRARSSSSRRNPLRRWRRVRRSRGAFGSYAGRAR